MELTSVQKELLMDVIKDIDKKSFIGIMVVHYSEAIPQEDGCFSCEVLSDCLSEAGMKKDVPCQWGIRSLFQ